MPVSKWGKGLAMRLPKALVEELGLKPGDELNVVAAKDGTIAIETKEQCHQRARSPRIGSRKLPECYKFDRDDANER